jgi:hypothetical protein
MLLPMVWLRRARRRERALGVEHPRYAATLPCSGPEAPAPSARRRPARSGPAARPSCGSSRGRPRSRGRPGGSCARGVERQPLLRLADLDPAPVLAGRKIGWRRLPMMFRTWAVEERVEIGAGEAERPGEGDAREEEGLAALMLAVAAARFWPRGRRAAGPGGRRKPGGDGRRYPFCSSRPAHERVPGCREHGVGSLRAIGRSRSNTTVATRASSAPGAESSSG